MQVIDGYEAVRQIRRHGYTGLIVGVTANALEADRVEFIEQGVDAVVIKPVNVPSLLAVMDKHLSAGHTRGASGATPRRASSVPYSPGVVRPPEVTTASGQAATSATAIAIGTPEGNGRPHSIDTAPSGVGRP